MTATDRMLVWLRETMDAAQRDAEAATAATGGPHWHGSDSGLYSNDAANHPGPFLADAYGYTDSRLVAHITRHDPAAVLRRIAAERKILAEHASDGDPQYPQCVRCADTHPGDCECGWHSLGGDHWRTAQTHPCATVRALAEGYGWTEETT